MIDYHEGRAVPCHGHRYCRLFTFAQNIPAAFLAWHDDFRGFPRSVSDAEGDGHLWWWWLRKDLHERNGAEIEER